MALGLLAAARDLGVDVPGDLAVVGYDDTAGAGFFSPPLTTLGQPFDELGRLCLEALLEGLGGAAGCASMRQQRVKKTKCLNFRGCLH